VDGIVAYPEPVGGIRTRRERSHFMGRHKLEIGENELPALPLTFNKEMARRNVVVQFGMKSQRHPGVFHRKFHIVGPGLFQLT